MSLHVQNCELWFVNWIGRTLTRTLNFQCLKIIENYRICKRWLNTALRWLFESWSPRFVCWNFVLILDSEFQCSNSEEIYYWQWVLTIANDAMHMWHMHTMPNEFKTNYFNRFRLFFFANEWPNVLVKNMLPG